MSNTSKIFSLFTFLLCSFSSCAAQNEVSPVIKRDSKTAVKKKKKQSLFSALHDKNEILKATLTTDLSKLKNFKNRENYWEGQFVVETEAGEEIVFDTYLRLRGMFRLVKCDFPPLKLKLKKKSLKKNGFRKRYRKMKLVTHCLNDEEVSRDLILREYLAYRLYRIINEFSFRVKLAEMTYINTTDKKDVRSGLGVFIEDSKELADRIGGTAIDTFGVSKESFNLRQEQLTSLFQFMISNTDWNNKKNRNVKLIETEEEEFFTVPYDFDFSGFVSAPYALLTGTHGQKSLKDRVFLGNSKSVEELQPAIDIFLEHETEILDEISNFKLLARSSRSELKKFIKGFYKILNNPKKLETALFPKEKTKK